MLYLMGDAFYRWDGFRYYGSLYQFIPSLALVTVLWSIVSVITAITVWLLLTTLEWICQRIGVRVKMENMLVFLGLLILFSMLTIAGFILDLKPLNLKILENHKTALLMTLILTSLSTTWLLRAKAEQWTNIVQERITPLVWFFSAFLVISLPVTGYHTWFKGEAKILNQVIGHHQAAGKNQPNIILVTFDALTARNMSVYGYDRPTTPFIGRWAERASIFTMAESESNYTAPTTASLMTGKRVWTHQRYHSNGLKPLKGNTESLPLLLKQNGYYNMAFIVNCIGSVEALDIANSFDVAPDSFEFATPVSLYGWIDKLLFRLFGDKIPMHDWIIKGDFALHKVVGMLSRNVSKTIKAPEIAFGRFLSLYDNRRFPEPFFVWIHLLPPHMYYLPPAPYMGMYDSSPQLRTLKNQERRFGRSKLNHYITSEMEPSVDTLEARYDEFIRYCDSQYEDFVDGLSKRVLLKNSVIILSSDHGEIFKHNRLFHGTTLYEAETNIPLIIKEPGQTDGRIINRVVEQIDIPATILDLAEIPIPPWMEGRSLVPLMRGMDIPPKPVISMSLQKSRINDPIKKGLIAAWEGNYKLIYDIESKKSLLFDLNQDPNELNNLFEDDPESGRRLLNLIKADLKDRL